MDVEYGPIQAEPTNRATVSRIEGSSYANNFVEIASFEIAEGVSATLEPLVRTLSHSGEQTTPSLAATDILIILRN